MHPESRGEEDPRSNWHPPRSQSSKGGPCKGVFGRSRDLYIEPTLPASSSDTFRSFNDLLEGHDLLVLEPCSCRSSRSKTGRRPQRRRGLWIFTSATCGFQRNLSAPASSRQRFSPGVTSFRCDHSPSCDPKPSPKTSIPKITKNSGPHQPAILGFAVQEA